MHIPYQKYFVAVVSESVSSELSMGLLTDGQVTGLVDPCCGGKGNRSDVRKLREALKAAMDADDVEVIAAAAAASVFKEQERLTDFLYAFQELIREALEARTQLNPTEVSRVEIVESSQSSNGILFIFKTTITIETM